MSDHLVVLITAESEQQARQIAQALLEQKLAACVNLVPVNSMFVWAEKIQEEAEVLMIIKSTSAVFQDKLIAAVKAQHSYDVPEIIGLPVVVGAADYLKWVTDEAAG